MLLQGPNLYTLLTSRIIACRSHPIDLCVDILTMFREVGLHPDDRNLHFFLQPEPNGEAMQDMRMTRC